MIPHSFKSLQETCIISLESFEPMVTKLCFGHGKRDTDDAADQSNTYMSPFQATQQQEGHEISLHT